MAVTYSLSKGVVLCALISSLHPEFKFDSNDDELCQNETVCIFDVKMKKTCLNEPSQLPELLWDWDWDVR